MQFLGMTEQVGGFSASYDRWAEAQGEVIAFERVVFRDGHQLTEAELSRLQALRRAAAACLGQVIDAMDVEYGRLHARPERHEADHAAAPPVRPTSCP